MRDFRQTITEQEKQKKISTSTRITHLLGVFLRVVFMLVCITSSAFLLFESFPKNSNFICAWLAIIPFVWGLFLCKKFWTAFIYSGFTFFLAALGILYWIYYTCLNGGGLPVSLSMAAWIGLCAILSLQFALWGGCCFFFKKTGMFFPLCSALGFVTFEWLHQVIAFYGLGFPWLMLGYSQWNFPEILQIASYLGMYGISFFIVYVGTSLGCAFINFKFKNFFSHVLLAGLVFSSVFFFGRYQLSEKDYSTKNILSVDVALMQPNIDQYKKWDTQFEKEIIDTIDEMGWSLVENPPHLVVWPESTIQGNLLEESYYNLFKDISTRLNAHQIMGSNIVLNDSNLSSEKKQYVGAYLMSPNTPELQNYTKIKLVPFGEYVPMRSLLSKIFPDVSVLGALGGFTPGGKDQPLLNMDGTLLGQTICYESIFPSLWINQNKEGAKLFVNITNDAWFFKTAAPYQHLAINVLRAVETGRPVLRAANTGFSALISPFGEITKQSNLFEKEILRASVPLSIKNEPNFYTQWGDLWVYACVILFATLLISFVVFAYE